MIAYKGRDVKRGRKSLMARNLERLYKEGKCRDCSVIVTRMDFAKILGKFTKVKIQYENVSSPKTKKGAIKAEAPPTSDTSRLKTNENGMVLARRNAYNKHPINNSQLLVPKKSMPRENIIPRSSSNVLKENNGLTKTVLKNKNNSYNAKSLNSHTKQYTIIFVDPKINNNNRVCTNKVLLTELAPNITNNILPSEDWCIDYLPKTELRQEDKVYDRIEAELEGIMFSEKQDDNPKPKVEENKVDEFPSIMDILNDNYSVAETKPSDQHVLMEYKSNLESSDVEAMLLGKSSNIVKISQCTPMEVDSSVMNNLIEDVDKISASASIEKNTDSSEPIVELSIKENPQSPSILDGALEKGEEEHIPAVPLQTEAVHESTETTEEGNKNLSSIQAENITMDMKTNVEPMNAISQVSSGICNPDVTHVIFKKLTDGRCIKTVTCPKNLKYSIELEGKPVEFIGAPKQISCIEDLQVLLQIVNESELHSLYVLH